ncbi:hypothetical protein BDN70DRAFT_922036 [Pholiota conissans]|uniref:F-box domain-containing protein n=1 Tax=Pholiota conissans TaxID=109636 RepID=A0A9P5Z162_9AGAR|nr:hypothetical protein BDN70DRAFT_922036 [Pholiota conissans]
MPTLPYELNETIIDILANSDDPKLSSTKACALVCHDFHHICRRHLFSSVALCHTGPSEPPPGVTTKATVSKLVKLLRLSPDIGDYIRHLSYSASIKDSTNPELLRTFQKISRLEFLSISHGYYPTWTWPGIDSPLRPALLHLLQLPTLISLDVYRFTNFYLSDLVICTNLERFYFKRLDIDDHAIENLPQRPSQLRKIAIGDGSTRGIMKICEARCADGAPFIDFNKITHLLAKTFYHDIEAHRALFSRCRQLTSVSFSAVGFIRGPRTNFTEFGFFEMVSPSMQTLKSLSVQTDYDHDLGNIDPFNGLCLQLDKMRHRNIIETISVQITTRTRFHGTWAEFDAVLTQSGWPKLQCVSLTLMIHRAHRAEAEELKDEYENSLQVHFPKLSSGNNPIFKFTAQLARP